MGDRSDVLNQIEIQVLGALRSTSTVDERFVPFSVLSKRTELTRDFVRAACRSLTDMGFAEYQSGLWTDDGEMAGSGYAITATGIDALDLGAEPDPLTDAAPDLLTALEASIKILTQLDNDNAVLCRDMSICIAQCRAAIAKAKGVRHG